ncbi:MAG TPA: AMP-binding protein [Flavobacteriales bacterium]|nr:AMP-binding protein [Flavobacteriales bacterium]HRE95753.1 AMP-binding protein [Flavobacteriales bacterium]HRJ38735.1 AMP-binding protein [Flavobacteriales bacterium]
MEQLRLDGKIITAANLHEVGDPFIREFLSLWWSNEDHIIVTTSGSTGKPKSIAIKKSSMLASAQATISFFGLHANTKALLCLPAQYIAGRMMLVRAIVGQWEITSVRPDSNPAEHLFAEQSFDFAAMIPLQISNALESNEGKQKLNAIKTIIIGGGESSERLIRKLQGLQCSCYATYGMTETVSHIALRKLNSQEKSESYTLLKGIRVDVDDRSCLIIDAPHLHDERLITNDVVEFTDLNKFRWLGRADHVINSGGLKIHPEQVEKQIAEIITDRRFYLSAKPDDVLGQRPVLVLEGDILDKHTEKMLLSHLKESLPRNQSPAEIVYINTFKETPTGKVIRSI